MASKKEIRHVSGIAKVLFALCISGILIACSVIIYLSGAEEEFSLKFLDTLFRMRGVIAPRDDIIIIEVDPVFKKKYRETNAPLSRVYMAEIMEHLRKQGAGIIAFDKLFLKPDWSKDGDAQLAEEIDRCWDSGVIPLLAGYYDPSDGLMTPMPALQNADVGLINLHYDKDNVVRRQSPVFPLVLDSQHPDAVTLFPTLSLLMAAYRENIDPSTWKAGNQDSGDSFYYTLGDMVFYSNRMLINFTGGPRNFRYISADALLSGTETLNVKNALVLVADTTAESQDFYTVPFRRVVHAPSWLSEIEKQQKKGGGSVHIGRATMPGVEVHANMLQSFLDRSWIRQVDTKLIVLIIILVGILMTIVSFIPRIPSWFVVLFFVMIVGIELYVTHTLFAHYIWFDIVPVFIITGIMLVAGIVYKNVILARANRQVAEMFGQYVSPQIVEQILKDGIDISTQGKTEDVTVLFSDIRGFTSISEKLSPEEIGTLLNTYFNDMINIVFTYDGTLDKLMGDAIMAFYGNPVHFEDHPVKACNTALDMMKRLHELTENPPVDGIEMINIGIGLNSGPVTVGDLGSFEYRDYTVIGDNVNLGSRVEGMNKLYGTNIIITEFTYERVSDMFECRKLDKVRVKGKSEPVVIYELIARRGEISDSMRETIVAFEQGLQHYFDGEFSQAYDIFKTVADTQNDAPSKTFCVRSQEYSAHPPESWDGVYIATSK